jgi:hypothetical protein
VRYRTYFPPGYPYEARARAALEANAEAATNGIVSFRVHDEPESDGGYKLANLMHQLQKCKVCGGHWCVWAPYIVWSDEAPKRVKVDPGKCPACHPVAAELEPEERARLLAELAATDPIEQLAAALTADPSAMMALTIACDSAQTLRAPADYRSPRDIARIAELETALESAGLLV